MKKTLVSAHITSAIAAGMFIIEGEYKLFEHRTTTTTEMPNVDMVTHHRFIPNSNSTFMYKCDSDDSGMIERRNHIYTSGIKGSFYSLFYSIDFAKLAIHK